LLGLCAAMAATGVACSGATFSGTQLFAEGGAGDGASGSGSGGSSGSSGGSSGSSGGSSSGGDASSGTEAGGGTALTCGTLTCTVPGQTCCVTQSGGQPPFTFACENGSTCSNPNAVALQCTSTADCPATEVCCFQQQQGGGSSQCVAQCGGGGTQLCDPHAPNNGGCPQGQQCNTQGGGGLPGSVGTCGG
jgi:hypothetical protein